MYREDRGWGFGDGKTPAEIIGELTAQIGTLNARLAALEEPDIKSTEAGPVDSSQVEGDA